jgi:hypothetical protein
LHPEPVSSRGRRPELEAAAGAGDGTGPLAPAVVEQDDEGLQYRRTVRVTDGTTDYLLGREIGDTDKDK